MRIWWRHCDAYICYCRLQSPLKRHAVPRPCDASMLIKIPSWGVDPTMTPNKNRNPKRKRGPFCTFELNIFGRDSAYMNGLYRDAFFFLRRISTLDIVCLKDESSDLQLILPYMAYRILITRIVTVNEASHTPTRWWRASACIRIARVCAFVMIFGPASLPSFVATGKCPPNTNSEVVEIQSA